MVHICMDYITNFVHNTCEKSEASCFPTHSQFMTTSSQEVHPVLNYNNFYKDPC